MKIIGISGLRQSGKNTVGDLLFRDLILQGKYCKQYAFADPIKEATLTMFSHYGITKQDLYGPSQNRKKTFLLKSAEGEKQICLRHILTTLGTEWGRTYIDNNVWVDITLKRIQEELKDIKNSFAIITDCRFSNEARAIIENNGDLYYIKNDKVLLETVSHQSETEMLSKDFQNYITHIIDNNGSITELTEQIKILSEKYK